jgi:hypothetical protein
VTRDLVAAAALAKIVLEAVGAVDATTKGFISIIEDIQIRVVRDFRSEIC